MAKKREILRLIGLNHILKDGKLSLELQKPLQWIAEVQTFQDALPERLEPKKAKALQRTLANLG